MRLCIVSHAYFELGYRPALESLACQPGIELALVTPERYILGLQTASSVFEMRELSCRVYKIPIYLAERQGTFLYDPRGLRRALEDFQPDVVLHEQEVFTLGAAQIAFVAHRRSIPLVHFVWENLDRSLASPRRWIRRYVFDRCRGLIAGSAQAAEVHQQAGFKGPVDVILQAGVAVNHSPALGRRAGETLEVCFAGSLLQRKGVDCLLRAVAEAKALGSEIRCSIAGDGPERGALEALVHQLSLADSVKFLGTVAMKEVARLLRSSDVLVLPSRCTPTWKEQFGRILVEAMAEATVVIGSRTGAIPEVIGSEDLVFPENDSSSLARLLVKLDRNEGVFASHQRRLWQRAQEEYSFDVVAQRKATFLQSICANAAAAGPAPGFASREHALSQTR